MSTVATVGLAGCTGIFSSGRSPAETVKKYNDAVNDGDVDALNSLIHEDANKTPYTEERIESWGDDWTIPLDSVDVIDETDESVIVEATGRMKYDDGSEEPFSSEFTLRQEDGEWKIYEIN